MSLTAQKPGNPAGVIVLRRGPNTGAASLRRSVPEQAPSGRNVFPSVPPHFGRTVKRLLGLLLLTADLGGGGGNTFITFPPPACFGKYSKPSASLDSLSSRSGLPSRSPNANGNRSLFISTLRPTAMLFTYKLNYSGFIDAPANIAEARRILMEKMKADPASFIAKLEPAEPSCHSVLDVFKKALGAG